MPLLLILRLDRIITYLRSNIVPWEVLHATQLPDRSSRHPYKHQTSWSVYEKQAIVTGEVDHGLCISKMGELVQSGMSLFGDLIPTNSHCPFAIPPPPAPSQIVKQGLVSDRESIVHPLSSPVQSRSDRTGSARTFAPLRLYAFTPLCLCAIYHWTGWLAGVWGFGSMAACPSGRLALGLSGYSAARSLSIGLAVHWLVELFGLSSRGTVGTTLGCVAYPLSILTACSQHLLFCIPPSLA